MKTKFFLSSMRMTLLGSLVFAGTAFSQEKKLSPRELLKNNFEATVDMRFDQPYVNATNPRLNNPRQMLDLYLPKKPNSDKPLPIVVYIHGGGWVGGDRSGYANLAAKQA